MDEKYRVGVNRFAKNNYYIFENNDLLKNVLKLNRHAYPELNSEILFISNHGVMETVIVLDIDKVTDKITIRYKGENFRFDVNTDCLVTKWKSVNQLPPEFISYYNQSDSYMLKSAIEALNGSLDNFIVLKNKHFKKIHSDSELRDIEKMLSNLQYKMHNILENKNLEI